MRFKYKKSEPAQSKMSLHEERNERKSKKSHNLKLRQHTCSFKYNQQDNICIGPIESLQEEPIRIVIMETKSLKRRIAGVLLLIIGLPN